MVSLPTVTGAESVKAFQRLGFHVDRIVGSHHQMKREGFRFILTVPVHGSKPLKSGTLRKLIRTAGITVDIFIEALDR